MTLTSDFWALSARRELLSQPNSESFVRASLLVMGLAIGLAAYDAVPNERVTTQVHGNLKIVHSRFGSVGSPETVILRLSANATEPVTIRFSKALAENYELNGMSPVPNTVTMTANGSVMTFEPKPNSEHLEVALTLTPLTWGRRHLDLTASFAERLSVQTGITQLVVPF
jgi:hypothetical protein